MRKRVWVVAALVLLLGGCAEPAWPTTEGGANVAASPAAPKHLTTAIASAPPRFVRWMSPPAIELAGAAELEALVTTGLGTSDGAGGLDTGLAEQIPTVENGLWKLFPDGRMETSWKIRPNARWHDGTPVTAADFLFTAQVRRDRELPLSPALAYQFVQDIQAAAPDTVQVVWRQPYIGADGLFSGPALPSHLLEPTYRQDKTAFTELPYWTSGLVNTGPFKLQEWTPGSRLLLLANDQYALGRPHIDELEVKFLQDPTTLLANILSGAVEMTLGRTLSLDQALQVRDQWRGGRVDLAFSQWIVIYPEFIDPIPAVIANRDFRRALVHALDRQQMVDNLMFGLTSVTDTLLYPGQSDYEQFVARAPKYPYDARRAIEMMGSLGYRRGPDGLLRPDSPGRPDLSRRDSANQPLSVEIRTSAGDDQQEKSLFASADDWRKIGIAVETVLVPPQRANDREYRNTFPGFDVKRQPADIDAIPRMHGSATPLPENQYIGSNFSRYINPELDGLIDRYSATIPRLERTQLVGQIAIYVAEHLNILGLYYQIQSYAISQRMQNVRSGQVGGPIMGAVFEWEMTS